MYSKNIQKKSMGLLYTKVFSRCEEHLEKFRISLIVKRAELDGNWEGNCEIEFKVCYPIIINPF